MTTDSKPEVPGISTARFATLPAHERVLGRLADVLFGADEVLQMLTYSDATGLNWIEPHVQKVYDDVNAVMKRLCD